jgi:hypothetical protein
MRAAERNAIETNENGPGRCSPRAALLPSANQVDYGFPGADSAGFEFACAAVLAAMGFPVSVP